MTNRDIEVTLVIADQPAPADHPSECSLDHPLARDDLEAWLTVGKADDLDDKVQKGGTSTQLQERHS